MLRKNKRNTKDPRTPIGFWMSGGGTLPVGYSRLLDSPEIGAAINRIAELISCCTIYLMQNTKTGDKRIKGGLSRIVDIDPWPGMMTGQTWKAWIVQTLLGEGDGNAFVQPVYDGDRIEALIPMPGATCHTADDYSNYFVLWRGSEYSPQELIHFKLFPDEASPWLGRGYRVQAGRLAASLAQSEDLKDSLSAPDYKPPLIVTVNSDSDLADEDKREAFRKSYLEDSDKGKPWILPADLVNVTQVKPLSLTDLAIADTVTLDKRTAASIFGLPPFLLGVGEFNQQAYNGFVHGTVQSICKAIEQPLTLGLLKSEELYYEFNRRRLYSYDLASLINMDLAMSDRGFVNGDEVREDAMRDPAGLTDFRTLENYIPWDMAAAQSKLVGVSDSDTGKGE